MKKNSEHNQLKVPTPRSVKAPLESPGSYYLRVRKSGSWAVMLETYLSGKRKQRTVQESMYTKLGFQKTMTVEQAKIRVRELNVLDKKEQSEYRAMIFAGKRAEKWQEADKIYFPPQLMDVFVKKINNDPGLKEKYRNRLLRCFEVITEMIPKHVEAMPFEYNSHLGEIITYFCKQKYSISYSSDIIMVLNMWARHYSKFKGTYADVIGRMSAGYREALNRAHASKDKAVRKRAIPITRQEMDTLWSRIDRTDKEQMAYYRWIRASWLFGLRPSELDRFVKTKNKTD